MGRNVIIFLSEVFYSGLKIINYSAVEPLSSEHLPIPRMWTLSVVERFSFECRKVIGFALATLHDWFEKFAPSK